MLSFIPRGRFPGSFVLTVSPKLFFLKHPGATGPKTICGGGQIVFVLADTASASTHVPAQMAICAGGRLPANTDGAVLAGAYLPTQMVKCWRAA